MTFPTPARSSNRRPSPSRGELRFTIGESSLGLVLIAQSASGLSAVLFGDDRQALRRELQSRFPRTTLVEGEAIAADSLAAKVLELVESPAEALEVPLDLRGTDFQRKVWQALQTIPAGSTVSYTDIATRIGVPTAVRAVARACGANPLAVVVPCHRVISRGGKLSGYHWGPERKQALLARESATAKRTLDPINLDASRTAQAES